MVAQNWGEAGNGESLLKGMTLGVTEHVIKLGKDDGCITKHAKKH